MERKVGKYRLAVFVLGSKTKASSVTIEKCTIENDAVQHRVCKK